MRFLWAVDNADYLPNVAGLQESVKLPTGVERGKVRTVYGWRVPAIPPLLADRMSPVERDITRATMPWWMDLYDDPTEKGHHEFTVYDVEDILPQQSFNTPEQIRAAFMAFPMETWAELYGRYTTDLYTEGRRVDPGTSCGMFGTPVCPPWRVPPSEADVHEAIRDMAPTLDGADLVCPQVYSGGDGMLRDLANSAAAQRLARAVQKPGQKNITFISPRIYTKGHPRYMQLTNSSELYAVVGGAKAAGAHGVAIWDSLFSAESRDALQAWCDTVLAPLVPQFLAPTPPTS